jgi:hypothetical protein
MLKLAYIFSRFVTVSMFVIVTYKQHFMQNPRYCDKLRMPCRGDSLAFPNKWQARCRVRGATTFY